MDFQGQFVNRMRLPQTGKGNKGAGKGKGKGKPFENPEIFLSDSSEEGLRSRSHASDFSSEIDSVQTEPDAVCTRCAALAPSHSGAAF